ncbi:hypothetical protein Bpla01_65790 [Burkholderia plantarii]|nr:hypothetical protein Bpla01_65790 [Burkholderia plantarii]
MRHALRRTRETAGVQLRSHRVQQKLARGILWDHDDSIPSVRRGMKHMAPIPVECTIAMLPCDAVYKDRATTAVDRAPRSPAGPGEPSRSTVINACREPVAENGHRTCRLVDQANEPSEAARQEAQTGKVEVVA